jgi:hypothetical protein
MRPPNEASDLVTFGIAGLALLMAVLIVLLMARAARRTTLIAVIGVAALMAAEFLLAQSGFLARTDLLPPPLLLMMVPLTVLVVRVARSPLGARIAEATPLALLIGLQGFRLPLELLMHRAAAEQIMPSQMTWTGVNFDVVTGASALVLGVLAAQGRAPRGLVLAWSAMGLGLLLAVVVIAVSSMPAFAAFGPNRTNGWITHTPFVWLPGVLVETALFLHILILRKLAQERRAAQVPSLGGAH